jgi:hypothetical protein
VHIRPRMAMLYEDEIRSGRNAVVTLRLASVS